MAFAQCFLALAQRIFGPLAVFDIGIGPIPFDQVSFLIAKRHGARQEPAVFSIGFSNASFEIELLAFGKILPGSFHYLATVVTMDDTDRPRIEGLLPGETGIVKPALVDIIDRTSRQNYPDLLRDQFTQEPQLSFTVFQLLFSRTPFSDVDYRPDVAGKLAAGCKTRDPMLEDAAILSISAPYAVFHFEWALCVRKSVEILANPFEVLWVYRPGPALTEFLFESPTGEIEPGLVEE